MLKNPQEILYRKGINIFLTESGQLSWTVFCHVQDIGIHHIPNIPVQECTPPHDGRVILEVPSLLRTSSLDSVSRFGLSRTVVSVSGT